MTFTNSADSTRAIAEFWRWFQGHAETLKRIRSSESTEYTELEGQLAKLSPDIDVEIGGNPAHETLDLIFTAHGDASQFALIDQIVSSAPPLAGWRVLALKPPLLEELLVQFEDEEISTNDIWIRTTSNWVPPDPLRLEVALSVDSEMQQDPNRQFAASIAIESFLGERAYALEIKVEAFVEAPSDPDLEGFVRLEYVAHRLGLSRLQ